MRTSTFSLLPALLSFWMYFSNQETKQPVSMVEETCNQMEEIKTYDLFQLNQNVAARSSAVSGGVYLDVDAAQLKTLHEERPHNLQLRIPTEDNDLVLELHENEIFTEDFIARAETENGLERVVYKKGVYYAGHIAGDPKSVVTISVFENWVMGILSYNGANYNLGPIDETNLKPNSPYIFYKEKDHLNPPAKECETSAEGLDFHYDKDLDSDTHNPNERMTSVVKVYIEADYKMYLDRNRNEQEVINYVTGIFNEVAILYANEQILTRISEIKVWTVQDPYPSGSSNAALDAFTSRNANNFNGDLGHLLSTVNNNNGGLAWLNVLCVRNRAFSYSNISNNFSPVPTFSWTVEVFTHEMGHNLGSPHTQACRWGPNSNAALDNCYPTEGGCPRGPAPTNGGTIMSYCHLASYGINFQNGFGLEPGNLVRNRVAQASCLEDVFDCFSRIPLEAGVTYNGSTANGGARNFANYPCIPGAHRGNEVAHKFTSLIPGWAYINYSEFNPDRLDLFLMSECNPDSCVEAWVGGPIVYDSFFVESGKEYVFVVDVLEDSPGGEYSLTISFPGSGCATTISMSEGVTYGGNTAVNGATNFTTYTCNPGQYRGPEVGHFFISPTSGEATISFTENTPQTIGLFVASACNQDSCIQYFGTGTVNTTFQIQAGTPYYFITDVLEDNPGGAYQLTISMPDANNCICSDPEATEICENFESFSLNGIDGQSLCWNTASGTANPVEDGVVSDDIAASGDQSLLIDATGQSGSYKDLVIDLGDRTTGKYILKFKSNIAFEKDAYLRVFHTYEPGDPNNEVAFDIQMEYSQIGGFAKLYAGNTFPASTRTFAYFTALWSDFIFTIDLDNDQISMVYQGSPIHTWAFSNTRNGTGGLKQLAALNFYSPNDKTKIYIDDFRLYPNDQEYCFNAGAIWCDGFDTYPNTAVGQVSNQWTTITGAEGSGEDASVVFENSLSGLNSMKIQAGIPGTAWDNVIAELGTHTSGKYKLQFKMFVPYPSNRAMFRIMHSYIIDGDVNNEEYASQVTFELGGQGIVLAGGAVGTFRFPHQSWFDVVQLIDFGLDQTTLFVDGRPVGTWTFSDKATAPGGLLQLQGVSFLAHDDNALFYIDNMELIDLSLFLNVDPEAVSVEPEAGSTSFNISSNTDWQVTENTSWFSIAPPNGSDNGTVTINYQENTSLDTRTGRIRVKGEGVTPKYVDVNQAGAAPFLTVNPGDQNVGSDAGFVDFTVTANVPWGLYSSDESWLTTDVTGGNLNGNFRVNYTNNLGGIRVDTIIVSGPTVPNVVILITQGAGGPSLDVSNDTIVVPGDAGNASFDVISNVNWTLTDDAPWFMTDKTSGSGIETVQVDYETNPLFVDRFGHITVSGDMGVSDKVVVVKQLASVPTLIANPLVINLPASPGGTVDFDLNANVNWDAVENASWFSINQLSGSTSATITITYDENTGPVARTENIVITGTNGVADQIIVVNQDSPGASLSADPLVLNLPNTAGNTSVTIIGNVDWNASANAGWLSLDPASGNGDGVITVTYMENLTLNERTATITITGSNGVSTIQIPVTQAASQPFMNVDPTSLSVSAPAGTINFDIITNVPWSVTDDANWLSLSPTNGVNNGTVTVNFNENTATQNRCATITVAGQNGVAPIEIEICQEGVSVTIDVSTDTVRLPYTAGNQTFDIMTNVQWALSDNAAWFSVTPVNGFGNQSPRINHQLNPSAQPREGLITITATGANPRTVVVIQDGAPATMSVNPLTLNIPATAGSVGFDITGNVDWTAAVSDSWLSVNPESGSGDASVLVTYQENPTTSQRTATITIEGSNGVATQVITVIQAAGSASVSVTPTVLNVTSPAGSTTFNVISNTDWTIIVDEPWASVDIASGTGNTTITVTYEENTDPTPRTARITVMATGVATGRLVLLNQEASTPTMAVNPTVLNVPATAGSANFVITANVAWDISENSTWLNVNTLAGTGGASITVTYDENTDPATRSDTIFISGQGVPEQIVIVNQEAGGTILNVNPTTISVGSPAGTTSFDINSNVDWTIMVSETWLSLSQSSGSNSETIAVDYELNSSTSSRMATITIKGSSGVADQVIVVTQAGAAPILQVSPVTINVSADAGTTAFNITSNVSWTVTENATWLSVTPSTGTGNATVTINYDANPTSQNRSTTITISGAGGVADQTVIVTQAGGTFVMQASPTTLNVSSPAGSASFNITSNVGWTVSSGATWFTLNPSNGTGNGMVTVNYEANPLTTSRSATITVTGGNGVPNQQVTITQAGQAAILTVNPVSLNVSAPLGSTSFQITSNLDWSVQENISWLTVTPGSGSGNSTITINYDANPNTTSRSGNITISANNVVPDQVITITQSGSAAFVNISPLILNVTAPAGSTSFNISSNSTWTVTDNQTWLSVTPSNGTGNGTVMVNYDENAGASARTAAITISSPGLANQIVQLTQAGTVAPFLIIEPGTDLTRNSQAGNIIFTITSNISWNISDDVPWLTMAPESGTGNGSVVASYSANLTANSRVATITLTGAGVPDKIIRLTQEAFSAFLLVNPQNHDVGEQAGNVTFDLNANVAWTVNVDVPWVSVNPNFGSGNFTLTASYQANPNPVIRVATITITSGLTGPVTVTITQSASTATSELEAAYKFALFPNPAKEALNLSMDLPNADLVRLEILTLDGKRIALLSDDVLPSGKQNFNYDVSTLAGGVYLVKMQVEEGMIVRRFVVQR